MLRRSVSLTRAGVAGLVWAIVFSVPFSLSRFIDGDMSPHPMSGLGWVALTSLSVLFLSTFGLILALPFTALLDAWEARSQPDARRFLTMSVLLSACWGGLLVYLHVMANPHEYYPEAGLTGTARVAMVHLIAALAAGYVVGRYLPQTEGNPAERAYRRYGVLLWSGFCFGVLLLIGSLWPTFGISSPPLAMVR